MIDSNGPKIVSLKVNKDDRGFLTEILRKDWQVFPEIKQVYTVESPAIYTVRAWHKHSKLWDAFSILRGRARVLCCKRVEGDPPFSKPMEFILSEKVPEVLVIPAGLYHGWQSLSDDCLLLSIASEVYNYDQPDEERIPYDALEKYYGNLWEVHFR